MRKFYNFLKVTSIRNWLTVNILLIESISTIIICDEEILLRGHIEIRNFLFSFYLRFLRIEACPQDMRHGSAFKILSLRNTCPHDMRHGSAFKILSLRNTLTIDITRGVIFDRDLKNCRNGLVL